MAESYSVELAPLVIILIRRSTEGVGKGYAAEAVQRPFKANQDDGVAPDIRWGLYTRDLEEIQSRSAHPLIGREIIEQVSKTD